MYKLQSIYPKQNQKHITHERNKLFMLQTGTKGHEFQMRKYNDFIF